MQTLMIFVFFFFFQAEDGIRDIGVTGVQTCALPICRGYSIITVADLQRGAEWALQPLPVADVQLYGGELAFSRLLALVQAVTVCVGTPGWIVPACLLTGTPLYCVAGGIGGHNGPDRIAPGFDHVGFALPDNYCMCYDERHDCPKHISDFEGKFNDWLTSKNL